MRLGDMTPLIANFESDLTIISKTDTLTDGYVQKVESSDTKKGVIIPSAEQELAAELEGLLKIGDAYLFMRSDVVLNVEDEVKDSNNVQWKVIDRSLFEDFVGVNVYTLKRLI